MANAQLRSAPVTIFLEGPVCQIRSGTPGYASRRPISKNLRNSVFLRFFEIPDRTQGVPRWMCRGGHGTPIGGGDGGTNGCAIGGVLFGVSGPYE